MPEETRRRTTINGSKKRRVRTKPSIEGVTSVESELTTKDEAKRQTETKPITSLISKKETSTEQPTETKAINKFGAKTKVPTNIDDNEKSSLIPIKYKSTVDPEITGNTVDSEGQTLSTKGQVFNAIIEKSHTNNRSIEEINDELQRASQLDNSLSIEQEKAQSLLDLTETGLTPELTIPNEITTDDVLNEIEQVISGLNVDDLTQEDALYNLFNNVNSIPMNYSEPAIERLGLQEYYPDINTPLQVGTYSGSIVGSNPIFVGGGGFIPVSIIDARKRAMERAAQNRVKQGEKIKNLLLVNGAQQYQDQINEAGLGIFNKYGEAVGWDFNKLMDMSNPIAREFQEEYYGYKANAGRTLKVQNQLNELVKTWEGGKKYIPPFVWEAIDVWNDGSFNFEQLMENPKAFSSMERTLQAYDSITNDAEDLSKVIQKDTDFLSNFFDENGENPYKDEINKIISTGSYDILRSGTYKGKPIQELWDLSVMKVSESKYDKSKSIEENEVMFFEYLNDLMGTEILPKYIEAGKKSTRVSVNVNTAKSGTVTEESGILGNHQSWRVAMNNSWDAGSKIVADSFEKELGIEAVRDEDGNFKNNEIRGKYTMSKDQNAGRWDYPAGELKFTPAGTGENYNLLGYQDYVLKTKYGLNPKQIDEARNAALRLGEGSLGLYDILRQKEGIDISKEDAYFLSMNEGTMIKTSWQSKNYVEKYQDPITRKWSVLTTDDPDASHRQNSVPFNAVNGWVLDPDDESNQFQGVSFSVDYNINMKLGTAPQFETYSEAESRNMWKGFQQKGQILTQEKEENKRTPTSTIEL